MASLPVDVLLGLYLGALVGILPALGVWAASFGFRYREGLSLPRAGAVAFGLVLAGLDGWLLVVVGETALDGAGVLRLTLATGVVLTLSTYAHAKGDRMAAEFPRRLSLSELRGQALSKETADLIEEGSEVRVQVVGEVTDVEGYPPLPERLRAQIRNAEFELPADLRLAELERRVTDRLETVYDLAAVDVEIDERGRARVAAAPPFSGLSKRVGGGRHAVSVSGLVPTGIARGDEVTVITPSAQVRGTVISARSGPSDAQTDGPDIEPRSDEEPADGEKPPQQVRTPTTDGGDGQVTVAVTRTDVQPLLRAEEAKIVVESRDLDREYEVVSMLRRVGHQIRRIGIRSGSRLDGAALGTAKLQANHDVAVLAVKKDGWQIAPGGETTLQAGDELFAAGTRQNLDSFETTAA